MPSALHAIAHKGSLPLWLSSLKSLVGWDSADWPRLWAWALCCSSTGCFSHPTSLFSSFCYTTIVLKKPTPKHISPRTRGLQQRSLSGMPNAPTAFTFKSFESRGDPQRNRSKRSVNVKGTLKNRSILYNQRTVEL